MSIKGLGSGVRGWVLRSRAPLSHRSGQGCGDPQHECSRFLAGRILDECAACFIPFSPFGNVLGGPAGLRCSWAPDNIHGVAWGPGCSSRIEFCLSR